MLGDIIGMDAQICISQFLTPLGPVWTFFLVITHHSSLNFRHSSLKISNSLHHTRLATDFNTLHSNISTFLWVRCLSWVSDHFVISTVPLPFTPSTECLSHHSLPLLLAPKKSKLKKLKQRAKHRKQASASVTCKADAVALCVTCDSDIHSVNPLAHRHDRVPVEPFFAPSSRSSNRALCRVGH